MLFVTGDIHGDWNRLQDIIIYLESTYDSVTLLVAGDFGIWDIENVIELRVLSNTFRSNTQIFFVDGNHENYDILHQYPIIDKFGGQVQEINQKVFRIMRGSIVNINGYSVLGFGGATSTDKEYRIPFISWWPGEQWNQKDRERLYELLDTSNLYVDIVLTHEAPATVVDFLYNGRPRSVDTMTRGLELLKEHIDYGKWFFGHHHQDTRIPNKPKGTIIGVYQQLHTIDWK